MSITLIIHEATRTGAPRIGGLIGRELARREPVDVVLMKDGPLEGWIAQCAGGGSVKVFRQDEFFWRVPFAERVELAKAALAASDSDVVYVNSLAASIFVFAAKALGRKVILHVHEKTADIENLLRYDIVKVNALDFADAVILAADDQAADIAEIFKADASGFDIFGVAVDSEAVRAAERERGDPPKSALGLQFCRSDRPVVGMCGHASPRKGVDIFYGVAKAMPNCDFIWVGGWSPQETIDNVIYDAFIAERIPNLYTTGSVDNPYPYMSMFDVFFLSSREDTNPVVVAEAMTLGVPVLCFSGTSGVTDRLGRSAILCFGAPNVDDAVRILRKFTPAHVRSPQFRGLAEDYLHAFDIREKMAMIQQRIALLRQANPS